MLSNRWRVHRWSLPLPLSSWTQLHFFPVYPAFFFIFILIGRLSKWVWERKDSHAHIRLSHLEELFYFIHFHAKPKLLSILNEHKHSKLYMWIACNLKFQHGQNLDEFCTRYSVNIIPFFLFPDMTYSINCFDYSLACFGQSVPLSLF